MSSLRDKLKAQLEKKKPERNVITRNDKSNAKSKEECPYCDQEFVSVNRHLPYCSKNPDNQEEREESNLSEMEEKTILTIRTLEQLQIKVTLIPITDQEFKTFESDLQDIYKSNYKRLRSAKADGKLNSLEGLVRFKEVIKKRGNL